MINIPILITTIATVVFMKRSHYSWAGSILTGIFASPLMHLFAFAIVTLGVNISLGIFNVSEEAVSGDTVYIASNAIMIAIWLIAGFFISQSLREKTSSSLPIDGKSE